MSTNNPWHDALERSHLGSLPSLAPNDTLEPSAAPPHDVHNHPQALDGFDLTGHFLNPMVSQAKPLMGLAIRLRTHEPIEQLRTLHRQLQTALRNLISTAEQLDYDPTSVKMMSYTLCLLLDETIMGRPWGNTSFWSQASLLSEFHQDAHGGETFFVLLDRLIAHPQPYLDVLELIFVCLCIGLRGKYAVAPNGNEHHQALIKQLHALIRTWRPPVPVHRPLSHVVHQPMRTTWEWPWWGSLIVSAVVMIAMFSYFNYRLERQTDQVVEALKVFF